MKTILHLLTCLFIGQLSYAEGQPNLIYIMVDDMGVGDLGCYGQKKIKTPELDRMAEMGMRFTQHYAGSAVCAPSRCILMTGKHGGHAYIRANSPGYPGGQTPIPAGTETLATMLKREGYATACVGKWGLGGAHNVGGANKQGFDLFFGYYDQRHAHEYYTDHLWKNDQKVPLDGETYSHDLMTKEAFQFMDENHENPFFLYLAYTIPHTKFQVPELGQYEDKPWEKNHKTQAAMISYLDRDIGRLLKKLNDLGISENTLVTFTSDNGAHGQSGTGEFFNATAGLRGIKRSLYEGGVRTPFLAYWPGKIKAGSTSDHISIHYDTMATYAELTGATPKSSHDGISYLPTLLGKKKDQKTHDHLYWELYEGKANRAVRMGKWKGVYPDLNKNETFQLFNLEKDEKEMTDLSTQYPEIVEKLQSIIKKEHVDNPFWNLASKGFNAKAACDANGVVPMKKKPKKKPKK